MVKEALDRAVRHQRECAKSVMRGKADCAPVLVAFLASTAPGWRGVAMIRSTSSYSERIGRISRWCAADPFRSPRLCQWSARPCGEGVVEGAGRGQCCGAFRSDPAQMAIVGASGWASSGGNNQHGATHCCRWCGPSAAAVKTVWRTSSTMPVSKKPSDREEGQCRRLV